MAKKVTSEKRANLTSRQFIQELKRLQSDLELKKIQRYFKTGEGQFAEGDKFIGVPIHEVRAGAAPDIASQFD